MKPLGIEYQADKGGPARTSARCGAWAWLAQDGSDYFHLHHTADDTLDKIDPKALAQNVAATLCSPTWRRKPMAASAARPRRPRRRTNDAVAPGHARRLRWKSGANQGSHPPSQIPHR